MNIMFMNFCQMHLLTYILFNYMLNPSTALEIELENCLLSFAYLVVLCGFGIYIDYFKIGQGSLPHFINLTTILTILLG